MFFWINEKQVSRTGSEIPILDFQPTSLWSCVFFQVKDDKIFTFPDDFLWGAATAAYQIEGADPWKNGWHSDGWQGWEDPQDTK